jgi:hypothetical protein
LPIGEVSGDLTKNELDWIFAYGSNMDLNDLHAWFKQRSCYKDANITTVSPAQLPGYRLVWNYYSFARAGGAANIEPVNDRDLPGLALSVGKLEFDAIDEKEGHPNVYSRGNERQLIQLADGTELKAWVYIVSPSHIKPHFVPPQRKYLNILIRAANQYRFPIWYLRELEATPVVPEDRC